MTEGIIIALVSCFGIITTALLTYLGVKRKADMERVGSMETRLNNSEKLNAGMWIWNRGLQDQIYRGDKPPPIDPPDWVKSLLENQGK